MADPRIGDINVKELLTAKIKQFEKGWVGLISAAPNDINAVRNEILRIGVNEMGFRCYYISLRESFATVDQKLKLENINVDNVFYIDAISPMYLVARSPRCFYAASPSDTESIVSSLREALTAKPADKKFVLMDTITNIFEVAGLQRTLLFSKFLVDFLKKNGISGSVINAIKKDNPKVYDRELEKNYDESIRMESKGKTNA
jgi:uncharacterized protein (DUF2225 family)